MKTIIGKVAGVHGIKGEIKIFPLLHDLNEIEDIDSIFIQNTEYVIESWRLHKNMILMKLENINTRNDAELLSGEVEAKIELNIKEGEYLIQDLIGINAKNQDMENIGKVINFSQSPQNLILVELNSNYAAKRELLVPFVEDYIIEVNLDQAYIKINLTEDLLDLVK